MGQNVTSRTPQGVRGLKLKAVGCTLTISESHPARGAWIEISTVTPK